MGRNKGSKDLQQRTRTKKSETQKKKDNEARALKKARKEAEDLTRNDARFRGSLFSRSGPPLQTVPATLPPEPEPLDDAVELRGVPHWNKVIEPDEITAELDYNADEQPDGDEDANSSDGPANSVMNVYLHAIQRQLKTEVKETTEKNDRWLLQYLDENDWWILRVKAKWLCAKLSVPFEEIAYYRDVYVWLPEHRWGDVAWPPCPSCFKQDVAAHGFRDNHSARRVITMNSHYFVMSRRYMCRGCNRAPCDPTNNQQVTFMGYNNTSRTRLPHGLGEFFPSFFTHRAAVDKGVIDLMRPLFDKGVRPESFAETILELHSKKYFDDYLMREFEIERKGVFSKKPAMFSAFANKMRYAGLSPTGKYLSHVYKSFNATIRPHLDKEIKKQPSTRFHIDASYKEAKHLAQYHGHPLFKSLITVTNEFGAIRLQFHTVTDGHDQMHSAVSAFVNTATEYGQALPELASTDNPSRDQKWLCDMIPSLRKTQASLNRLTDSVSSAASGAGGTGGVAGRSPLQSVIDCSLADETATFSNHDINTTMSPVLPQQLTTSTLSNSKNIRVASSVEDINRTVLAVRQIVSMRTAKEGVIALDAEWDTKKNRSGQVIQSFKTALIQLGYRDSENRICALLLQVYRHQNLPQSLLSLLGDPKISFVGASVSGDLKRIGKDFNCTEITDVSCYINLGSFARKRDVVLSGTASLEKLVQLTIGEKLDKAPAVRLSKWSVLELTDEQKKYAALDAMKSLEVYERLLVLPDLTLRLSVEAATPNLDVDIVPAHGNVASMATRAAIGVLSDKIACNSADGITPHRVKQNEHTRVVTITSVMSPSLVVPGLKKSSAGRKETKVCLSDFGAPPFSIVLPLKMLKQHVDSPTIRLFSEIEPLEKKLVTTPSTTLPSRRAPQPLMEHDIFVFLQTDERRNDEANADDDGCYYLESELQQNLTSQDLDLVRQAGIIGDQANKGLLELLCVPLDTPPENFNDCFSAILGDTFHAMNRPKVPVKHEYKKPYFVALQQAFFAWRPDLLADVKDVLASNNFSKEDIEALMYYDVDFFRQRVDRRVLPPKQLYWRVRAVFTLFGNKVDSKTKRPLFNERVWMKANNVLKEILLGYYSDPPGFSFYTNRLNNRGEPMVDQFGIALLDCNRGTNDVEAIHKQLVALYGTWCTGVEMSDALLSERRHRYNHKINERKRLGFPKLGHYNTWKVDALQLLVEKNHNILLYPDWSNSSDYKNTPESFGTVALHSDELHQALDQIELADDVMKKFTGEMKYIACTMGVKVPFLPVYGADEAKLFTRLVLEIPEFDELLIAIEWCKYVNGTSIFPKLPVYLRLHYERWERNQRVRDAVRSASSELQLLKYINNTNMLHPTSDQLAEVGAGGEDDFDGNHDHNDSRAHPNARASGEAFSFSAWTDVAAPTAMAQPHYLAIRPHHQLGPPIVGGLLIGLTANNLPPMVPGRKRRVGQRGKDSAPRKKKSCRRCAKFKGTNGLLCQGRLGGTSGGTKGCQFFRENGEILIPGDMGTGAAGFGAGIEADSSGAETVVALLDLGSGNTKMGAAESGAGLVVDLCYNVETVAADLCTAGWVAVDLGSGANQHSSSIV